MSVPILVTFIAYFIILLGVGLFFYGKSRRIEDYLLGGRQMGAWVTALPCFPNGRRGSRRWRG